MNFFFENLSLLPETRAPKEHFKLVFGSGNSDLAKIRPLKVWTSWISPWVPPYGILPQELVLQKAQELPREMDGADFINVIVETNAKCYFKSERERDGERSK